MSSPVKVTVTADVKRAAVDMLDRITKTKRRGLIASKIGVRAPTRGHAAQWLRQQGVPLMATRKGPESRWWVAAGRPDLADQWRDRMIRDAYVEVCRAHMALKPHAAYKADAGAMAAAAVMFGSHLGIGLDEVLVDITPVALDPAVAAIWTP
jgi:hypothetical protein